MKRIFVILISFFSFAIVFADEKSDSTEDITLLSDKLYYESFKRNINTYRQKVGDVSRDTTFAQNLIDFAIHCYYIGECEEANNVLSEVSSIYKEVYGVDSNQYETLLCDFALYCYNHGHYDEAIRLGEEAWTIIMLNPGTEQSDCAWWLTNLSCFYSEQGNNDKAIRLGTEAMEIRKRILGPDHPDYATSLSNLANFYSDRGNFVEAIRLGTEAMEIRKRTLGIDDPDYATSLGNLAGYYSYLGNDEEALRMGTEAMVIRKRVLGQDDPDYAASLNDLSIIFSHLHNYNEAIRLGTEAMEIRKRKLGAKHPDYAMSLGNLASVYSKIRNYDKAIQLETEALEIIGRKFGTNHPFYAKYLGNLANHYSDIDNDEIAISLGTEALEIRKSVLGADHPEYTQSLQNLALDYYIVDNYDEAIRLLNEYVQIVRKNILSVFSGLTSNERQMYWNKYRFVLNRLVPLILVNSDAPSSSSILYDNVALFSKGLLLSTELEMAKLIQESGDDEAEQMYSELRKNRQILNFQYSKPIAERTINCDSLERVSTELERKLGSRVKEFGDYTRNLSITWKDVQSRLDDSDIAIEFLSFPENDSTVTYIALTLCKNDTAPLLTPLFTELQLKEVAGGDDTYQNAAADSLIWGALASRLEGKSHVYFSGSGLLHCIGIEYLSSMEGKDCYRLSSTRELVTHKSGEGIKSATLFGDIDYDATYALIKSSAPTIPSIPDVPSTQSTTLYAENTVTGPIISKSGRGGFDEYGSMRSLRYDVKPLPKSREEILDISALLKKSDFKVQDCDTITRNQASEESFKALSGQRRSLIHIATHGFYYDTVKAKNMSEHLRLMLMGDDRPSHTEDRSLLRCGLCFAGANQFVRDMKNPAEDQDDGILNALEIAQTDLRGLDLVVLSACQTALGDVVNGEGVFGLQRGFKKAGAQSILMSLWKVDDDITALLMTEFYRAWTSSSGKSKVTKAAALKEAQDIVKQKHPNPHDWAGFILIDALD